MANRIKGITVEIGGDTTKLQTALKGVNGQIKNTQSALKDVEKLLKLDPTNTTLLAHSLAPKAFGMDGPVISASSTPARRPVRCMAVASMAETVLLPTPPLPDTTAMTLPILDFGLGCACRLSGLRSEQASLQLEQLPPQDSLIMQKSPSDRSGVYGADIVMVYYSRCGPRTQVRKPQNS